MKKTSLILLTLFITLTNTYASQESFKLNLNYHTAYAIFVKVREADFKQLKVVKNEYSELGYILEGNYPMMLKYNARGGTFRITLEKVTENLTNITCIAYDPDPEWIALSMRKHILKLSENQEVIESASIYRIIAEEGLKADRQEEQRVADEMEKEVEKQQKYEIGKGYYEEAVKLALNGDFMRTSVYIDYALENGYITGSSLFYNGVALYEIGEYEGAVTYFNRAETKEDLNEVVNLYLYRGMSKIKLLDPGYKTDLEKAGPEGRLILNEIDKN